MKTLSDVYDYFEEHNIDYTVCDSYGEPGYELDNEEQVLILANWNDVSQGIQDRLTGLGVTLDWSDEYIVCDKNKAWRSEPDSYHFTPSYKITDDGDIITLDDDFDTWEEECANTDYNQPIYPILPSFALEDFGYIKYNDEEYQNGMHHGMDDSPEALLAEVLGKFPNAKVLFQHSSSQFYVSFDVYYSPEEDQ